MRRPFRLSLTVFAAITFLLLVNALLTAGIDRSLPLANGDVTITATVFLPAVLRNWPPTPTYTPTPWPTSTPLPTATSPPPPPDVRITYIEYTPPGDDVQGEYVRIQNYSSTAANMTSWTLRDIANHVFTFPSFTLSGGGTVRVWTKSGTNTATDLYWGSGAAIWNNTGDTAYLRDAGGTLVDTYTY